MASSDVCEHQNANYLRMMSERDALRAEVERLREDYQAACEARMMFHDELDEAQRQVADLRAGIEALAAEYEKPNPSTLAYRSEVARAVRALAGSGEQPGEVDGYCTCHDDQKGRTRDCGVKDHREAGRPAPAAPDSADVRERAIEAGVKAVKASPHGRWLVMPGPVSIQRQVAALITDAVLAAAGQMVPALLGFVREVRARHVREPYMDEPSEGFCRYCQRGGAAGTWPCPTEQAAQKWIGGQV